ncbi:MAG: OmpA family protein [Longimicrobiales bacterium]|jgi:outer membrane protein OmpA-like peptidoglycan-associated protein
MKSLEMGRCGSVVLMLALVLTLSSCATNLRTGAVGGAAAGAVIGGIASGSARGAIIGAVIGGAAGAAIGGVMDAQAEDLQDKLPNARVERIGEGIRVTFDSGILFDVGQSTLRTAARQNLRELAESLEDYEGTNVLVFGHTDSTGSMELNQSLSERRADAARTFLLGAGLENDRVSAVGRGEQDPVDTNETEAGRQANRRVLIAIYASEDMQAEMMRRHGGL